MNATSHGGWRRSRARREQQDQQHRLADLVARVRYALHPGRPQPGDPVVVLVEQRYRAAIAPDHLPVVTPGTRAVVLATAPMRGAPGGALVRLVDEGGRITRFWTAVPLHQLDRLPDAIFEDVAASLQRPLYRDAR